MGFVLIIMSVLVFCMGFFADISGAVQQSVQYLIYVCSTILFSCGFICLSIQYRPQVDNDEEFKKIISHLDNFAKYFDRVEKEQKKKDDQIKKQLEEEAEERRKTEYASFEEMMKNPDLLEGANMMFKMYGEDARRRYIEEKAKEFGFMDKEKPLK